MSTAQAAKRFLIINPFGIGDVVFSFTLVDAIKESDPHAEVMYLCNARTKPLVADYPGISSYVVYDRDAMERLKERSLWAWVCGFAGLIRSLRALRADSCFDLSMNRLFGFLAMAAGIGRRYGFDYKKRGIFLTRRIPLSGFEGKHVTEWYADVVRAAGIPVTVTGLRVWYAPAARAVADRYIGRHGLTRGAFLGVAPFGGVTFGSQALAKQWPPERYVDLIRRLVLECGEKIVLFGGSDEREEMLNIIRRCALPEGAVAVAADFAINETAALIDACRVFVSNDTGLLRIADALKKPCVALFGPVDDAVYGLYPYDPLRHRLLCSKPPCWPCYRRFRLRTCEQDYACIRGISVDAVFKAIEEIGRS